MDIFPTAHISKRALSSESYCRKIKVIYKYFKYYSTGAKMQVIIYSQRLSCSKLMPEEQWELLEIWFIQSHVSLKLEQSPKNPTKLLKLEQVVASDTAITCQNVTRFPRRWDEHVLMQLTDVTHKLSRVFHFLWHNTLSGSDIWKSLITCTQ